ncbi:ABC transporter ATP-binding protein, partial [Streptomyces lavendulae]|uniref:ABC transporter ATP-binding protein n=1 Tax=Streptomyces lavendulae TaxID=1914 RepID=UPI0031EA64A9
LLDAAGTRPELPAVPAQPDPSGRTPAPPGTGGTPAPVPGPGTPAGSGSRSAGGDTGARAPSGASRAGSGTGPGRVPGPAHHAGRGVALELRGVRAGYDGGHVLHGVDLGVRRGEVLAVLGPNGAGKSTACRVAAGLLPATGGSVLVAGRDATRDGPVRRARAGVLLAPEGRGIFPALTLEENLALYLEDAGDRRAVYDRFPRLGERRRVAAGALSGGEQQMLSLAPLLQRPPAVLIADEPSLGLAPRVVEEVYALLAELRGAGCAVLLVEERADAVLGIADSVAFLARGRVSWCGPRAEVDAERLTESYLGVAR